VLDPGIHPNSILYSVCSGRGVCAADPIALSVRCLCDSGYDGYLCESVAQDTSKSSSPDNHIGFQVAISVVTILVFIFIGVTVYLYMRNRTLEKFRVQLLEDEADDVINPPLHTEPKVPDDMYNSDSDGEEEEEEEEEDEKIKKTSKTAGAGNETPNTELTSLKPKENETISDNAAIKLDGPPENQEKENLV